MEVMAHMNRCVAEQKHLASEKAMEQLDPVSVQEVHENEWLKHEAQVHRYFTPLLVVSFTCKESFRMKVCQASLLSGFIVVKVAVNRCR